MSERHQLEARRAGGRLRAFLPVLAVLYVLGFLNLFLRSSFGVMAPDLARELRLTPELLSTIASAFFFAYALMQVPTGMLLDRFGPRRTLGTMLVFTTAGAALFAIGESAATLSAGRVLMGIGCAGIFTGAFFVLALWLPADRVVTHIGALNSFAAFGALCATAPLAALIAWIGWRTSYWWFTAAVALITVAVLAVVRDAPPGGAQAHAARGETFAQILAGAREAIRQPGMKRLLVAGLPMSVSTTVSGAWGAPYLKDVHGLDDLARGSVLLLMATCGMCGHFLYGVIARQLNTTKWTILTGGAVLFLATLTLAILTAPPVWLVTALFGVIALASAYPTITHAHARGLVPANLIGRGVSITNMGVMTAIALAQFTFGWIIGAFPTNAGVPPEHAYRVAFAVQAALAIIGLLIYGRIQDVKPRG